MHKKWWFWVLLIIVIGIITFVGYKWYKFGQCKKEEGKVCGQNELNAVPSGRIGEKYTKCNFWKGKTCE